jgi:hypothetical protein
MTGNVRSRWIRWAYWLSGLLLVLPAWYLYHSLNPVFPAEWPEQQLGSFSAAPMPANTAGPYRYDGKYYKDFTVRLCEGCAQRLRTAYLSVGPQPVPVPADGEGVLHGGDLFMEAHAPFPAVLAAEDRLWLTVQQWDGRLYHASWGLPEGLR